MRYSYNKGFRKKNRYSVSRSTVSTGTESTTALRIVRVVVMLLLIGVIIGTITIGVQSFKTGESLPKSKDYKAETTVDKTLLKVINKSNPVDKSYVPELAEYESYSVNVLAEKPLNDLLGAAESDGISLTVERAYTSYDEQNELYQKKYKEYRKSGKLSEVKAQAKAESVVPQAGRSEFQTGLLIRFKTGEQGSFRDTKASQWLERNAIDYGFILRYPEGKTSRTSMKPDFAAYRYVGEDNARVMRSLGKTFDEYSYYISSR